jgi:hypothetical protein
MVLGYFNAINKKTVRNSVAEIKQSDPRMFEFKCSQKKRHADSV